MGLEPLSDQEWMRYPLFLQTENWLFSIVALNFSIKETLLAETMGLILGIKHFSVFKLEKRRYLPHFWSQKRLLFKSGILSVNGGLLEITTTVF